MSFSNIVIVIPTLNPDSKIIDLVLAVRKLINNTILIVNDGSRPECSTIFSELSKLENVQILRHNINLGKGRALKTAFNFLLNENPTGIGAVTCDGDGQHLPVDIVACVRMLEQNPEALIMGCRNFSGDDIPWKSRFGNNLTKFIFKSAVRIQVSDTQTGLRGIPTKFMRNLMNAFGERFEFETEMLLACRENKVEIIEQPIATVYMANNSETHFRPVTDSMKIYAVIFRGFIRRILLFGFSGIISAGVDLGLFALLFYIVMPALALPRLIWSVIVARSISLVVNYLLNRHMVFRHRTKASLFGGASFAGYLALCAVIMLLSYSITKLGNHLFPGRSIVVIKLVADCILFFVSYFMQRHIIFTGHRRG